MIPLSLGLSAGGGGPSGASGLAGGLSGAGIFTNYAPILGPAAKAEYDASGQSVSPSNSPKADPSFSSGQSLPLGLSSTAWILIGFVGLSVVALGTVLLVKRK